MISKGINNLKLKACGFDPTNGYGHTQITSRKIWKSNCRKLLKTSLKRVEYFRKNCSA